MHGRTSRQTRVAEHAELSAALAAMSDAELRQALATARFGGAGIGGQSARLSIAGRQIFVKRVPLTELERRPEHYRSTANLYRLPEFCHYGVGRVGSPGFGAWRELAVHEQTTDWVRDGAYDGFPLLHHWRVLDEQLPLPDELADIDHAVAYWGGGPAIRQRIESLRDASASLVLFLECFPQNVHEWLNEQRANGNLDRACAAIKPQLTAGISFMNSRGLLHLDTHFENILIDGRRLYFTDFGLAVGSGFQLDGSETDFFGAHQDYDRGYLSSYLVSWLITAEHGLSAGDGDGRFALLGEYAAGRRPAGATPEVAAVIARHAPLALVVSRFNRSFQRESRRTPYPAREVARLLS